MPRLTVWTLRASLLYLFVGFTIGALLLANKGQPFWPQIWTFLPAHVEFLIVGWMIQLAFAVAFWILPRFSGGSRGDERLAVLAIIFLNTGVLLASFQDLLPFLLPLGRICEMGSGILMSLHILGRIQGQKFR